MQRSLQNLVPLNKTTAAPCHVLPVMESALLFAFVIFCGNFLPHFIAEATPSYSFTEFLQPMSNCQHVISQRNNESAPSSLSFVQTLTLLNVPFQYLLHLPNDPPENYARRHLHHCLVRHVFPAINDRRFHAFESAIAISWFPLPTVLVKRNKKTDLVFLYAERLEGKYPHFTAPAAYMACVNPLNFVYVLVQRETLVPLFHSFRKLTYEYITNTLKKKRGNMDEMRLKYRSSTYLGRQSYSWAEVKFIFSENPFYLSYMVKDVAQLQLAYVLAQRLNFTFDMGSDYKGECEVAAIDHYTYLMSGELDYGEGDGIRMVEWRFYKIVYATAVQEIPPAKLRTFASPATRTVWLLLGLAIALTALLQKAFISPVTDWLGSLLLVTAPYVGQIVTCTRLEAKLKFLFASWALIAVFLAALYTSVIQSLTVAPAALPGEFSLEDLLKNNYTMDAVFPQFFERIVLVGEANRHTGAKEKLLMKVIKPGSGDWGLNVTYGVEYFKKPRPMQLMSSASTADVYTKLYAKLSERNLNICKDQFASQPFFISFYYTPNSDVLESRFQEIWDAGFVTFWQKIRSRAADRQVMLYTVAEARRAGLLLREKIVEGTLLDSLIREGFYVFLYGICTALLGILVECLCSSASFSIYCK